MPQLSPENLSVIINSIVFLLVLIFSIVLVCKLKFDQKGYRLLFVLYTVFWIPLMLLRSYTGTMQKGIAVDILWLPMAAYGFIGIFSRIFADYLSFITKNRKTFIYLALVIQLITFVPILIIQTTATNVIQSLGVGVGASCIGTYELLFNEQYGKSRQLLTISVLSIPPLLADFISSPLQSIVRSIAPEGSQNTTTTLKWLWLIGLGFVLIAMVLCYFVKQDRNLMYQDNQTKKQLKTKNEWFYFCLLCLIGSIIAFIKFSNTGSIATLHIQRLSDNTSASYEGYVSVMFSVGQLVGGLLAGLVFVKWLGRFNSFSIGCVTWIVYHIIAIFVTNPYGYLAVHWMNGLAYGITYNLMLGFILTKCFKTNKVTPMGIYQSVLSIGITVSQWFTSWLKQDFLLPNTEINDYLNASDTINYILIGMIIIVWFLYGYSYVIESNQFQTLKLKFGFLKKSHD